MGAKRDMNLCMDDAIVTWQEACPLAKAAYFSSATVVQQRHDEKVHHVVLLFRSAKDAIHVQAIK